MLPAKKGGNGYGIKPESNPDLLINGQAFDVFSPNTTNVRNIWSTIEYKSKTQASRIVLNLDDYKGPMDKLQNQFYKWKIDSLDELLIVKNGSVTRLLPK